MYRFLILSVVILFHINPIKSHGQSTTPLPKPIILDKPTFTNKSYFKIRLKAQYDTNVYINDKYRRRIQSTDGIEELTLYDFYSEDGINYYKVHLTDDEGNQSPSTTFSIQKDSLSPPKPTFQKIPPARTPNDSYLLFLHVEPQTHLFVNGTRLDHIDYSDRTQQSFYLDLTTDRTFSIYLQDRAGNQSEPLNFTIEQGTKKPRKPTVDHPIPTTNQASVDITLNGASRHTVYVNGIRRSYIGYHNRTKLSLSLNKENEEMTFSITLKNSSGIQSDPLVLTILRDTRPPTAPTVTEPPTRTNKNSLPIEIQGEIGSAIFVNNTATHRTISENGNATIVLDTRGYDGQKSFSITLQDELGNKSDPLTLTIEKDTKRPPSPTLVTPFPNTTYTNTMTVHIQGTVGSRIAVNGNDIGQIIDDTGRADVLLDTSGKNGSKLFDITLKDDLGNESYALNIYTIRLRIEPEPPTLHNIPAVTVVDDFTIEVQGQVGTTIYINGINSHTIIPPSGRVTVPMNMNNGR